MWEAEKMCPQKKDLQHGQSFQWDAHVGVEVTGRGPQGKKKKN